MRARLAAAAMCLGLCAAAMPVIEPDTYRTENYRAPTPTTLHGAAVVDTEAAHALWVAKDAAFIDVLPQPPRPAGLPADTIWHPRPRDDIPGSVWLPDTGYGVLPPAMEGYFRDNLARVTGGDHDHPIVIYCLAQCWMSWNAARRAVALGYTHVNWYRDGTDGWAAAGYPMERRTPEKRPGE